MARRGRSPQRRDERDLLSSSNALTLSAVGHEPGVDRGELSFNNEHLEAGEGRGSCFERRLAICPQGNDQEHTLAIVGCLATITLNPMTNASTSDGIRIGGHEYVRLTEGGSVQIGGGYAAGMAFVVLFLSVLLAAEVVLLLNLRGLLLDALVDHQLMVAFFIATFGAVTAAARRSGSGATAEVFDGTDHLLVRQNARDVRIPLEQITDVSPVTNLVKTTVKLTMAPGAPLAQAVFVARDQSVGHALRDRVSKV